MPRLIPTVLVALIMFSDPNGSAQANDAKQPQPGKSEVRTFLDAYQSKLKKLEVRASLAAWKAANTGEKEDFDASAEASLAIRKFHSDPDTYQRIKQLSGQSGELPPVEARSLYLAKLAYERNQLPPELLEKLVELSTEIERTFNTFRGMIGQQKYSNNDLLEMLREETDSGKRKVAWEALKQVGGAVAPKLIELAKLRNRAAAHLGYDNYWEMSIRLQEHDAPQLLEIFDELDRLTLDSFTAMKGEMDRELAERFDVEPEAMMPWHYDNPFFQAAPPSDEVNLDEFYKNNAKEEIAEIARVFFDDVGLPADNILRRSDLYEREGKDQHAFCISIDRGDDVRTLCNIKPTAEWMDTTLHELGHAVYDVGVSRSLPYNLRGPAHACTTEGVAMLFGALAKTPSWMIAYADAKPDRVNPLARAILEQRRREQLIFARWTMVMLNFEKAFYENPQRDLNRLWWDYVQRYQLLDRPANRDQPDWAAKPHFTIAPVYYHNYMLGELFAAQLRDRLAKLAGHEGPTSELSFVERKDFGDFLEKKVFNPGAVMPWPEFVRGATGEPLTAEYFAAEVK